LGSSLFKAENFGGQRGYQSSAGEGSSSGSVLTTDAAGSQLISAKCHLLIIIIIATITTGPTHYSHHTHSHTHACVACGFCVLSRFVIDMSIGCVCDWSKSHHHNHHHMSNPFNFRVRQFRVEGQTLAN